jgi:alpha-beta hydrolase superfamily lysophospholipase
MTATPVYFGAPERALFGLYHPPEGPARDAGVVWCPPIGAERAKSHRALRHLAERLAAAGFAVLRFDPHGTGNSAGDDREPGRLEAWIASVDAAAAEVRARSGCKRVVLGGLRLGATLAAVAAARSGAASAVVLWSPWITGERFLHAASRAERLRRALADEAPPPDGADRESCGQVITPETALDLRRLDLLALGASPAPRALVVGTADVPEDASLVARLAELGAEARYSHVPGHAFLDADPHRSDLPHHALETIVAWMGEAFPRSPSEEAPASTVVRSASLAPHLGERALAFGAPHRLFGILHEPRGAARAARPAVLYTSAGAVDHTGPCRMHVQHARALAQMGFPVLRFDLSGIGESPAREGCEERLAYPEAALPDVREAMDAASEALPGRRFVLMGLCSGADHALAAALDDHRVAGLVLMNPLFLGYRDAEEILAFREVDAYRHALRRPESWRKLLRGEVDVRHAAAVVSAQATRSLLHGAASLLGRDDDGALGDVRALVDRGVDVLLVFSPAEAGLAYVEERAAALAALRPRPGFRMEVVDGDHTFTSIRSQDRLRALIVDHLGRSAR